MTNSTPLCLVGLRKCYKLFDYLYARKDKCVIRDMFSFYPWGMIGTFLEKTTI